MLLKYLLLIIVFFSLMTAADARESLWDYMETAAQNNPGLLAAYQDYLAALQQIPQVGALPDPKLMFGYFIEPVQTRVGPQDAKVSLDQMFPWFGVLSAREQIAAERAKALFESFLDQKARLQYDVQSAYYQLYYINKSIQILDQTIRLNESIQNLVQIQVAAGRTSAADDYRTQMMINELKQQKAWMEDEFELTTVSFQTLLNLSETENIILPDSIWHTQFSTEKTTLLDSVLQNNPAIRSLDNTIASYNWQAKEARRSGFPQISLGIDYIFTGNIESMGDVPQGNGQDAVVFPRIGLSLPIFRGKYNARIDETIVRRKSAEYQKQDEMNRLREQIEEAYIRFVDSERRIGLYQVQLRLAEKTFRILQTEYSTDNIGLEELLRMEQQLLDYQLNLEKAKVERETAIAYINYLTAKTIGSEAYELDSQ